MGTRHLIAVHADGKYKLASYGQWDGYPSVQGIGVLNFLRDNPDHVALRKALDLVYAPTEEVIDQWYRDAGATDQQMESGFIDMNVSNRFKKNHPTLSRDNGSDILAMVLAATEPVPVMDNINFAADSLFCEYAYVVDLDRGTFEVFKGFNQSPLPDNARFYFLQKKDEAGNSAPSKEGYYPVSLIGVFALDDLPTNEGFLAVADPKSPEGDDEDDAA